MSQEFHRQFFNVFVECGSNVSCKIHVTLPAVNTNPFGFEKLFTIAGFNEWLCSTNSTHIGIILYSVWAKINYLGPKLKTPSRSYDATVTHCRQKLGTTSKHPASRNDKTITLYDELIRGDHEGKLSIDHKSTLLECDATGEVVEQQYQGAWFMLDNVYLAWSTTIPPMNHDVACNGIRFS